MENFAIIIVLCIVAILNALIGKWLFVFIALVAALLNLPFAIEWFKGRG